MCRRATTDPYESLQQRRCGLQRSGLADRVVILDTLDMDPYLQMVDVWFRGDDQRNMRPIDYPAVEIIPRLPGVSSTERGPNTAS